MSSSGSGSQGQQQQTIPTAATNSLTGAINTASDQGAVASSKAKDMLDKGISTLQEQTFGVQTRSEDEEGRSEENSQSAESARKVDQASTEQVADFVRDKYTTATAKDFPGADKKKFASMEEGD